MPLEEMSLTAKLVALGLIVAALAAGAWKILHDADRAGYRRAQAEYQARAELQREANRGRAGDAERKEAAQTIVRTRYITRIVKELDHATQDLASCPVPDPVRRLLNDAGACALSDRSSACQPSDRLRTAE